VYNNIVLNKYRKVVKKMKDLFAIDIEVEISDKSEEMENVSDPKARYGNTPGITCQGGASTSSCYSVMCSSHSFKCPVGYG